jgi:collagenase-like PrtC family protease
MAISLDMRTLYNACIACVPPHMPLNRKMIELLAPAKNAEFGIEAIIHGADAVYVGGPAFGARTKADNSVADIGRLASFAHRYNARVLVAMNTLLKDEELEQARGLIWQLYDAGADALIVQDMGLLELDLPPIQLHASTQTNIRSLEKARFLEDVGFSQIVLARELALDQIRVIANKTRIVLEFFVHGALCVSYSGLCNLSYAQTGRSANRGECSQACRLPYSLASQNGQLVAANRHLLSIKDNNQSDNLRALLNAGISSFKIEGRLKDLAYVKNITAHYRLLLDEIIAERPHYGRSSSGRSTFLFTPQPDKTFNRGSTDYFVKGRQLDIGAFDSPKFIGDEIGTLTFLGPDNFEVSSCAELHNGDGIAWFDAKGELFGTQVNRAEKCADGYRLFPQLSGAKRLPPELRPGTIIYRNRDQEFERVLAKKSAHRRIPLHLRVFESGDGFALMMTDDQGVSVVVTTSHCQQPARNAEQARTSMRDCLGRLGESIYFAERIGIDLAGDWFLPAATLNQLRRDTLATLDAARCAAYQRPLRRPPIEPPVPYPEQSLDYLAGVFNTSARAFYARHGVNVIEPAYECGQVKGEVSLMITKHCLRYSFDLCPKQVKGIRPEPMILINGKEKLTLRFDCKACEMHVIGKPGKQRTLPVRER